MTRLRGWLVWMMVVGTVAVGATDPEREAREIEDLLMAPCCFRQQVSVHQSPTANEVRRDIRTRLAKGETRQVILDAYVAEHGSGILVVPPAQGSNLVLYVLPPLALVGSVLGVVGVIRRFTSPGDAPAVSDKERLCHRNSHFIRAIDLTERVPPHRVLAISQQLRKLWPPGPYAIASATAPVVEGLIAGTRRDTPGVTVLTGEFGLRGVACLLPLTLGNGRIQSRVIPTLSPQERTDVVNSLR